MKKKIELLIQFLFDFTDKLFFKKEFIVFSARSANAYADNSKILFEALLKKNTGKIFYYTKNRKVLECIPQNGVYAYSFKGVYVLLKSRILVFTHGSSDFYPYFPDVHPKRIFINLFHAIAIKKTGLKSSLTAANEIKKWNYFIVSSDFEKGFIKKQYGFNDNQILICGQPRNDIIIKNNLKPSSHEKKLILYAPTFREQSLTKLFPFKDVNLEALDRFLGENSIEIMIRLHINEEKKYKNNYIFQQLKHIYFLGSNKIPSINDYLHNVDMIVSDYSSITLDYLLLNRPICYLPYDYDQYNTNRGFSFDYFKYLAGPIIKNQNDFQSFLLTKEDDYIEKRIELKNLFHKYQDGQSTKRLIKFIEKI